MISVALNAASIALLNAGDSSIRKYVILYDASAVIPFNEYDRKIKYEYLYINM